MAIPRMKHPLTQSPASVFAQWDNLGLFESITYPIEQRAEITRLLARYRAACVRNGSPVRLSLHTVPGGVSFTISRAHDRTEPHQPAGKRGRPQRTFKTPHDFDAMLVGDSFFVPHSPDWDLDTQLKRHRRAVAARGGRERYSLRMVYLPSYGGRVTRLSDYSPAAVVPYSQTTARPVNRRGPRKQNMLGFLDMEIGDTKFFTLDEYGAWIPELRRVQRQCGRTGNTARWSVVTRWDRGGHIVERVDDYQHVESIPRAYRERAPGPQDRDERGELMFDPISGKRRCVPRDFRLMWFDEGWKPLPAHATEFYGTSDEVWTPAPIDLAEIEVGEMPDD